LSFEQEQVRQRRCVALRGRSLPYSCPNHFFASIFYRSVSVSGARLGSMWCGNYWC